MADDPLITVSVRVPRSMTERVRCLASEQDRTVQATYTRAIRLGLDLVEEQHRIACEAVQAAERRRRQPAQRPQEVQDG